MYKALRCYWSPKRFITLMGGAHSTLATNSICVHEVAYSIRAQVRRYQDWRCKSSLSDVESVRKLYTLNGRLNGKKVMATPYIFIGLRKNISRHVCSWWSHSLTDSFNDIQLLWTFSSCEQLTGLVLCAWSYIFRVRYDVYIGFWSSSYPHTHIRTTRS